MISIPKDFAYATSIFSIPDPTRAIKRRWGAASKNVLSIRKRLRITMASWFSMLAMMSSLELLKSNTLVQPSLLNPCARISWLLSRWRTRMTVDIWN